MLSIVVVVGAAVFIVPRYLGPSAAPPPDASPALALATATATQDTSGERVAEGDRLMSEGRWAGAASAYAEAAKSPSVAAVAQSRWAEALVYANKPSDAIEHAQKAVDLDGRSAEFQAILALAFDWSGNADRAITAARRATELDPRSVRGQAYLAEAYTDKYRLREAEEALDKAAAAGGGNNPEVLRIQAYLLETKTDYAGAVTTYQRAVAIAPERSYLYLSLGHALRVQKQYPEAIAAFNRAVELNPQDARAEGGLGLVYYTLEEYDSARSHLERSIEVDPGYASGWGQLGWVYYVQRPAAYDKAQPYFEKAIELEKDPIRNAAYRHALGWIHVSMKRYDAARQEFKKALELNPDLQGAKEGLELLDKQP